MSDFDVTTSHGIPCDEAREMIPLAVTDDWLGGAPAASGELESPRAALRQHIDGCAECRALFERQAAVVAKLVESRAAGVGAFASPECAVDLWPRVRETLLEVGTLAPAPRLDHARSRWFGRRREALAFVLGAGLATLAPEFGGTTAPTPTPPPAATITASAPAPTPESPPVERQPAASEPVALELLAPTQLPRAALLTLPAAGAPATQARTFLQREILPLASSLKVRF